MNNEICKRVEKILARNGIWGEVGIDESENKVSVDIMWGDWKHDHLCCDYVLGKEGFKHITTVTTQEDGSDCYSAIHYFSYAA